VTTPGSQVYAVLPGEEVIAFNGTRSLTADGTTQYSLQTSMVSNSRYRLLHVGGTAPGFRTARAVSVSGGNIVIALNSNQTVTVTSSLGAVFGSVLVGDQVHIPGAMSGDAAVFDGLNEGNWFVLSATASQLVLRRASGTVFSGSSETVVVSSNTQFQVFGISGVQVGDQVDIVAGFASTARHNYPVVAVTANYIEFDSSIPLAPEIATPGATGVVAYSMAKRYLLIESDQEIAVKLNGETSETTVVQPWLPGQETQMGQLIKTGICYQCAIKNRSSSTATVFVATAE
jgi:hypothetical protein